MIVPEDEIAHSDDEGRIALYQQHEANARLNGRAIAYLIFSFSAFSG
jgi:hypothetical protein